VRHRRFSDWIAGNAPGWELARVRERPAPDYQDFFVYAR
jgi:hypothetical protein